MDDMDLLSSTYMDLHTVTEKHTEVVGTNGVPLCTRHDLREPTSNTRQSHSIRGACVRGVHPYNMYTDMYMSLIVSCDIQKCLKRHARCLVSGVSSDAFRPYGSSIEMAGRCIQTSDAFSVRDRTWIVSIRNLYAWRIFRRDRRAACVLNAVRSTAGRVWRHRGVSQDMGVSRRPLGYQVAPG
jgi:hypothetical protein